ncbi:MAG: hypothetical protein Kow0031_40210 [Anaerolineae bacterium]
MLFWRRKPARLTIYCDGATGGRDRAAGAAVIIRDEAGEIIGLVKKSLPAMTNNEAEYAALLLALEAAREYRPRQLEVFMDSEVVVGQMTGRFSVRSAALRRWHSQACRWVRHFERVTFTHIPREANELADALAGEALREAERPAQPAASD